MEDMRGEIPGNVRRALLTLSALAVLTACLMLTVPGARASDEDTSANVYLVFDPETGDFVTVDDPNAKLPNQTGLEKNAAVPTHPGSSGAHSGSSGQATASAAGSSSAATAGRDGPGKLPLIAAAVVILVVGGLVFFRRRSRQTSTGRSTRAEPQRT